MDHLSPSLGSFYWNWKGRAFVYYLTRSYQNAEQFTVYLLLERVGWKGSADMQGETERENTLMVSKPVTQVFLDPMFIPA